MSQLARAERAHAAALERLTNLLPDILRRARAARDERVEIADLLHELGVDDDDALERIA